MWQRVPRSEEEQSVTVKVARATRSVPTPDGNGIFGVIRKKILKAVILRLTVEWSQIRTQNCKIFHSSGEDVAGLSC